MARKLMCMDGITLLMFEVSKFEVSSCTLDPSAQR